MTGTVLRLIPVGEILPPLTLPGPDGPWRIPGPGTKASLLVIVHGGRCGPCARYLGELGGIVDDLQGWGTRVLGIAPDDDMDDVDAGRRFPVLSDPGGAARRRLGLGDDDAAVLLADRWGEVMEASTIGPDHGFPLPSQLVESAKIVDLSCGDCNVPGPEWREA